MFNGSVKILAGEIKTWYELMFAAIEARTYSADGPTNLQRRLDYQSRVRSLPAGTMIVKAKAGDFYVMDAYKNVQNGVTQSGLVAGDFTAEPGGGIKLPFFGDAQWHTLYDVAVGGQLVYAAADTVIYVSF